VQEACLSNLQQQNAAGFDPGLQIVPAGQGSGVGPRRRFGGKQADKFGGKRADKLREGKVWKHWHWHKVRQYAQCKHVPCLCFLLGIWPSSKRSRMRPVAVSPNSKTSRLTALPLLPPLPPSPPSLLPPPPLPPPPLPPPPLPPPPLPLPLPATAKRGRHMY